MGTDCSFEREVLLALLQACGASTSHRFEYCECPEGTPAAEYFYPNEMSEEEASLRGELVLRVWTTHHLPKMRDCRDLNYSYHITSSGRVICKAQGDYFDITDEIMTDENIS